MDSVTATIAAGVIGGLLGSIGTLLATQHQSRVTAAANFRAAFLPAAHILKPFGVISPGDHYCFLKKSFAKHSIAVAQFKPFLRLGEKDAFDNAWHTYYGYKGNKNDVYLEQYSEFSEDNMQPEKDNPQSQKDTNNLAHERLLILLGFAE